MSWMKLKKPKAKKLNLSQPEKKQPRSLSEIQKDHDEAISRAGILQYQIKVLGHQLEDLNRLLINLNNEGADRQTLDKAEAEKANPSAGQLEAQAKKAEEHK